MPKTFDIVMAVFDVGSHVVTQAAASISGSTSLDVQATLTSMFNSQIDSMGIGELIGLGMETMIISLCIPCYDMRSEGYPHKWKSCRSPVLSAREKEGNHLPLFFRALHTAGNRGTVRTLPEYGVASHTQCLANAA